MFEFFRQRGGGRINPQYWAEKITDGRERAKTYSQKRAEEQIWAAVRGECTAGGRDAKGLAKAAREELVDNLDGPLDFEETARLAIAEFEFKTPAGDFRFEDSWEWTLTDWSYHYLWQCHAIVWGINQYDQAKQASTAAAR